MSNVLKLILSMSLSGSVLILALFAAKPLFKDRFSKAWQYYVWLIVLLRLAIPYSPEFAVVRGLFQPAPTNPPAVVQHYDPTEPAANGQVTAEAPESGGPSSAAPASALPRTIAITLPWDLWQIAGATWLAGAVLLFAFRVHQYARFSRAIRSGAQRVDDRRVTALLANITQEMSLAPGMPVFTSRKARSPMLMGLARPAVFLPEATLELSDDHLSYVFRHELTHFKRHDLLYKWMTELILCVHWFNPLVYVMSNRLGAICELSCDEAVAKGLDSENKMKYGRTLLMAVSKNTEYTRHVLTPTLCAEDKKNLRERLTSILGAGRKPKRTIAASVVTAALLCGAALFLGACSVGAADLILPAGQPLAGGAASATEQPTAADTATPAETSTAAPDPTATAQQDAGQAEKDVRAVTESFGQALKMVSVLAPEDIFTKSLDDNYSKYVTPELLAGWKKDQQNTPGGATSSPWPDRIDIQSVKANTETEYTVSGEIIELTSVEAGKDGAVAAKRSITLTVSKVDDQWLISAVTLGKEEQAGAVKGGPAKSGTPQSEAVVYNNTKYGFHFNLPASWKGYTIVEDKWQGTAISDNTDGLDLTGPQLLIRSPKWTEKDPYQDIPIMVFTKKQWTALATGEYAVGAAPMAPSELGENSKYVFALPARYNYAFPTGYEEVEKILQDNPLEAE